jgi:hypothetical protein
MSRLRARFFGLAAVVLAATVMLSPATALATPTPSPVAPSSEVEAASLPIGAYGLLDNSYTGRCLSVHGPTARVGSQAFQHDCVGYSDQFWRLDRNVADNTYRITNYHTGLCLAVQGGNFRNGAPAYLYTCDYSYSDQKWRMMGPYTSEGRQYWYLQNYNTGLCLSVQGANNINGAPAFQHGCAGHQDQRWF